MSSVFRTIIFNLGLTIPMSLNLIVRNILPPDDGVRQQSVKQCLQQFQSRSAASSASQHRLGDK